MAEEDGHVGPLDPPAPGGQQLGGDRLDLQRRVPARHQHGRRRAPEGHVAEVHAGDRVDTVAVAGHDEVGGSGGQGAQDAVGGGSGRVAVVDEDVPKPVSGALGQQVGSPAEEPGDVHPSQAGEGLAIPGKESTQVLPGRVGKGTRLRRAVLQNQEGVGDVGHQRPAAQQVAERRPRRPAFVRQQPGDGAPLLSAGDQPDGPVAASDHVVGQPGERRDGQAVEPARQPRQDRIPKPQGRAPAPTQHHDRRRPLLPHQAQVPGRQRRRLARAGGPDDLHEAVTVVDHPPLPFGQLHPRRGYRAGETLSPG